MCDYLYFVSDVWGDLFVGCVIGYGIGLEFWFCWLLLCYGIGVGVFY